MAKIDLDKYYTSKKLAKYCIDVVEKLGLDITETIEPSAGNGAFSLQIPNCIAYDLEPDHESIIKQDFLQLNLPYKKGRLFIGNPPFGTANTLSVRFYNKCVSMGDYIAFILPVGQYNNNQQMYKFDLIHSEVLPLIEYCGRKLRCCFNVYQRNSNGLNLKPYNYEFKDVTVLAWGRGKGCKIPKKYDLGICSWGVVGKEIKYQGQFVYEHYIIVNNPQLKEMVIQKMKEANWEELYPSIASPSLSKWKIYKYLKECMKAELSFVGSEIDADFISQMRLF
jgi:hypothetical protein